MTAIDFRNNINWTWSHTDPILPPTPQKTNTRKPEEVAALIRQQQFDNSLLKNNSSGVEVRLASPEEREQAMQMLQNSRPAPKPDYYTQVIDDNLAVRKDKLTSHSADELNQRTSMVSVSGSYSEAELTAMMDATAEQRPDIASIIELMQPLQNGELSSVFSSRVNIGLPNQPEKVISMDTLIAG